MTLRQDSILSALGLMPRTHLVRRSERIISPSSSKRVQIPGRPRESNCCPGDVFKAPESTVYPASIITVSASLWAQPTVRVLDTRAFHRIDPSSPLASLGKFAAKVGVENKDTCSHRVGPHTGARWRSLHSQEDILLSRSTRCLRYDSPIAFRQSLRNFNVELV